MDFIAFDLETTGMVPGINQIVEIGAVCFSQGKPEKAFSTLINPRCSIPPSASAVNGISDNMVQNKPFIENILDSFAEFCESKIMVAHNAPFDAQFLISDIKKYESLSPKGLIIDTLPLAKKLFPGLPNYKLPTLIKFLKIPHKSFHRAEEDALSCGLLFMEILKRINPNIAEIAIENIISLTGKMKFRFPNIEKTHKQLSLF